MSQSKLLDQSRESLRFFEWIQIFALDIFDQRERKRGIVRHGANERRYFSQSCLLGGTPASLTGDDFEARAVDRDSPTYALIDIVATALQRNYPEMTPDKVENLLDLGNDSAVLNAVLTGSGLKPGGAAMGEASAPGTSPGAGGASANSASDMISETPSPGEKSMVSSRPPVDTVTP